MKNLNELFNELCELNGVEYMDKISEIKKYINSEKFSFKKEVLFEERFFSKFVCALFINDSDFHKMSVVFKETERPLFSFNAMLMRLSYENALNHHDVDKQNKMIEKVVKLYFYSKVSDNTETVIRKLSYPVGFLFGQTIRLGLSCSPFLMCLREVFDGSENKKFSLGFKSGFSLSKSSLIQDEFFLDDFMTTYKNDWNKKGREKNKMILEKCFPPVVIENKYMMDVFNVKALETLVSLCPEPEIEKIYLSHRKVCEELGLMLRRKSKDELESDEPKVTHDFKKLF